MVGLVGLSAWVAVVSAASVFPSAPMAGFVIMHLAPATLVIGPLAWAAWLIRD